MFGAGQYAKRRKDCVNSTCTGKYISWHIDPSGNGDDFWSCDSCGTIHHNEVPFVISSSKKKIIIPAPPVCECDIQDIWREGKKGHKKSCPEHEE